MFLKVCEFVLKLNKSVCFQNIYKYQFSRQFELFGLVQVQIQHFKFTSTWVCYYIEQVHFDLKNLDILYYLPMLCNLCGQITIL